MEEFIVTNNTRFADVAIDTVNGIIQDMTNHVDDIYICKTNIKKTGKRRNPEFAHDTDVGLDMYPCSLSLESYSGNSYKIELTEDDSFTERQIIEAEDLEKLQFPFWKRIINFLMGKEHRLGWKRLKFDTGIAIDPEITCFYYGAPNSRVVKTDVDCRHSASQDVAAFSAERRDGSAFAPVRGEFLRGGRGCIGAKAFTRARGGRLTVFEGHAV